MSAVEHIAIAREQQSNMERIIQQFHALVRDAKTLTPQQQEEVDLLYTRILISDCVISNHTQLAIAQAMVEQRGLLKEIISAIKGV